MREKDTKGARRRGVLFIIFLFIAFFEAGLYSAQSRTATADSVVSTPVLKKEHELIEHPIPKLMAEAEDKFRRKLEGQSKTFEDAVAEYRRRYRRGPPKGFDEWYKFAVKNEVQLIDEYNAINEDLAPFWMFSGEQLRQRVDQVSQLHSVDLVRIEDGNIRALNLQRDRRDDEVGARARGFVLMIEKFNDTLPNMDFPINGKSEGRILIPWEHKMNPNLSLQDTSATGEGFAADWAGDGNVWEAWRRTCPRNSKARKLFSSVKARGHVVRATNHLQGLSTPAPKENLTFVSSGDVKYDFCEDPAAHYQQGHFFSDWRTISALYPIFSPAKSQGFADIRVPSHFYYDASPQYTYGWDYINLKGKETDDMEVPWENKSDIIFWRGSTTGGGNSPSGFAPFYQRHRFVRMASMEGIENRTVVFPAPFNPTSYASVEVPIGKLNEEIMDVAFVRLLGWANYPGGRAALRKEHRFDKAVPLGEHWQYKYLVDLDGMGYSDKFFAFLASDSVPLKTTVYEEYFSDWIQPWLHYIPLSQTYEEIYNIFGFFSGPTKSMLEAIRVDSSPPNRLDDGDHRLHRIARAGKQWKKTIGRPVDIEAYVFRLALEWARLWSDDREGMTLETDNSRRDV